MSPIPVALFAYRRPRHLERTLDALARNRLVGEAKVTIWSDGPKKGNPQVQEDVSAVRQVAAKWISDHPFASLDLRSQESNRGLAASIIAGVGETLSDHGEVVVLEDDHVTAEGFLEYVRTGLDVYRGNPKVASIHAYTYPVDTALPETFFLRGGDCWGWATWQRAWQHFDPDARSLHRRLSEAGLARAFNHDGTRAMMRMLIDQAEGRNDSWAIRWHASAFLADLYTLYPGRSLVHNIGLDGDGSHCGAEDTFDVALDQGTVRVEAQEVLECPEAHQAFARFFAARYRGGWIRRAMRSLRRRLRHLHD